MIKFHDTNELLLFNVTKDLQEKKNLANILPKVLNTLEDALDSYLHEVKAPKWKPGINWKNKPIEKSARWSEEKAWEWHQTNGWMAGTNFNPSTSINQLEFFQEETFDMETIDRELGWSAELGMKLHRVYF